VKIKPSPPAETKIESDFHGAQDNGVQAKILNKAELKKISEYHCQKRVFAYTPCQMVVIKGPDVKKLTISLLHV
jgi:hypothetical protein